MEENVTIPGQPDEVKSPLIHGLSIMATALTATGLAVNLILQVVHHLQKRPVGPDQRDRLETAGLTLKVFKNLPALIKQVRLLASQLRGEL